MTESSSPSVEASRRWNKSRRRVTLFIPQDLASGIEGAELRAIAYKAVYAYLAQLGDEVDPDAP